MRPSTLSEACERVRSGEASERVFAEFWDTFYAAPTTAQKLATVIDEPPLTGDLRLDAYVSAATQYLCNRYAVRPLPSWIARPHRILKQPWHTCAGNDPGMIEYLTFASPGEFKTHNIFTESAPLRRARAGHASAVKV